MCTVRKSILTQKNFKKHRQTTLKCSSKGLQQTMYAKQVFYNRRHKKFSGKEISVCPWCTGDAINKRFPRLRMNFNGIQVLFIIKDHESRKSIHPLRNSIYINNLIGHSWGIIWSSFKNPLQKYMMIFSPWRYYKLALPYTFANMWSFNSCKTQYRPTNKLLTL